MMSAAASLATGPLFCVMVLIGIIKYSSGSGSITTTSGGGTSGGYMGMARMLYVMSALLPCCLSALLPQA